MVSQSRGAAADQEAPSATVALLLAATFLAGLVDAVSYIGLGHVFVANMTGNILFIGLAAAGYREVSVEASLVAIAAFTAGAWTFGRVEGRRRVLATAFALEALCLGATAALAAAGLGADRGNTRFGLVALLAFAMGVQTVAAHRSEVPDLRTTVLTSMLAQLAAGGARLDAVQLRRVAAIAAMVAGGCAGGALVLDVDRTVPLAVAAGIAATLALIDRRRGRGKRV